MLSAMVSPLKFFRVFKSQASSGVVSAPHSHSIILVRQESMLKNLKIKTNTYVNTLVVPSSTEITVQTLAIVFTLFLHRYNHFII